MKYIFSSIGGCGSTFLVKNLSAKFRVDNKPDTFFVAKGEPYTAKKNKKGKLLHQFLQNGYLDKPRPLSVEGFKSRTGYSLNSHISIFENLTNYINFIKKKQNRTTLLNTSAKFGLFSKKRISYVVFLIRHPLYAYLSFSKKNRHFNIIGQFGGIDNKNAIIYYAKSWNSIVDEYFVLKDKGMIVFLIRYEFALSDAVLISGIKWAFRGWKTSNKSKNTLSSQAEIFLKKLTFYNFSKIYDIW